MRLLVSWLRDFVDVSATPADIAGTLALRGFEVASIEELGSGDGVIDFEVTANRPDCLSVLGLAREVATAYSLPLRLPDAAAGARVPLATTPAGESDQLTVALDDPELCPRYAAAVAELTPASSPDWVTKRLVAAGVRPISPIVDITNYVLIELGQPMHAFDLDKLAKREIHARRAKRGEIITTLDGVERKLDPDMLVIADADKAEAVAGVMGGARSKVSSATRIVALESAYFKPTSVRFTSKRLGLKTEASSRFERGGDPNAAITALQRAIKLIELIGCGRVRGPLVDRYPDPRRGKTIHLRRARIGLVLGMDVPDAEVERILRGLGLGVTAGGDGWDVTAPTFRVDLSREADLIEEVGRHHGFDKLVPTFPPVTVSAPRPDPRVTRDRLLRRVLTADGLSEAVTFGFVERAAIEAVSGVDGSIAVANPLSAKFDTLRTSLLPGLIDAVAHNLRHQRDDVGLFEIGTRFTTAGETRGVGMAWTGSASPIHWSGARRDVDFFDLKGVVERICGALGVAPRFETARAPFLVAGQTATVLIGSEPIGLAGLVAPAVADSRGATRAKIFVAELDLDTIAALAPPREEAVRSLPRHPFVVRDLSIVVAEGLPAADISGTIQAAGTRAAALLTGIEFFDRYKGKGVPEGAVSISIRLTFQAPDRTLTDRDVQDSFDAILAALVREHGAIQR